MQRPSAVIRATPEPIAKSDEVAIEAILQAIEYNYLSDVILVEATLARVRSYSTRAELFAAAPLTPVTQIKGDADQSDSAVRILRNT